MFVRFSCMRLPLADGRIATKLPTWLVRSREDMDAERPARKIRH
ncbi:hypothetical protein LF599_14245 [Pseudodesulfovibrio thermohalotolerans]|nr:hypothetical protein [Pseudodesulfovibrio thermohalotolerans]WFS61822.1 hypothetical protein LF599_14245 [Pseudodesulfovibrio thermohalotolerans]